MNDTASLDCKFWDVPHVSKPTESKIINVCVVPARVVIKKDSIIKIPSTLPKSEVIIVEEEHFSTYFGFSLFIKQNTKGVGITKNVLFFADILDEVKFLYNIQCVWAAFAEKDEIDMIVVTLNDSLILRMKKLDNADCEAIRNFDPPLQDPPKEKSSIKRMKQKHEMDKKRREIEIFENQENMMFAGPIYKRNAEDTICNVTIWKRYSTLLLSLNSLLFTIDNQFAQINRTHPVDEEIVTEICTKVI